MLVKHGATIAIANKYGETPLSKARPRLRKKLECKTQYGLVGRQYTALILTAALAEEFGQSLVIVPHKSECDNVPHNEVNYTMIL